MSIFVEKMQIKISRLSYHVMKNTIKKPKNADFSEYLTLGSTFSGKKILPNHNPDSVIHKQAYTGLSHHIYRLYILFTKSYKTLLFHLKSKIPLYLLMAM